MLIRRTAIGLVLALLVALPVTAQDFEKGLAAAKRSDYATALSEWEPLAKQGDAVAQYNLAQMYRHGHGVPQDYQAAAKWYRLAAEQGDATAQYNLGVMYADGQDVPQDYQAAVTWFKLAANFVKMKGTR